MLNSIGALEGRARGVGWRGCPGGERKRLTIHQDHDADAAPERRQFLLKLAIFRDQGLHALAHLQQRVGDLFKSFYRRIHTRGPFSSALADAPASAGTCGPLRGAALAVSDPGYISSMILPCIRSEIENERTLQ
jgi:hypothetical protein